MLVQGAHGDFSNLTTKSTVKRQASSNFTAIKRNQGGTFQNSGDQLGFRASTRTGQQKKQRKRSFDPATSGFGLSSFTLATLVRLLTCACTIHLLNLLNSKDYEKRLFL